ncbi:hypothetical protein B0H16DRAFT_1520553 [Mycena metata]|uniref:Transmembrane protein n=1 Tax=Mycena metata TaxID=1033252 RepID=A0AAD7NNI8_9AGAR|nr:hypothetical protein B0H16DRAFT_1520553 [Mycena metata]
MRLEATTAFDVCHIIPIRWPRISGKPTMVLALLVLLLSLVALAASPTMAKLLPEPCLDAAAIDLPLATVAEMSCADASALPKTTTTAFMRRAPQALGFQPQATPEDSGAAPPGLIISKAQIAGIVFAVCALVLGLTWCFRKCRRRANKRRKGEGEGEDEKAKHTDEVISEAARQGMSAASNLLGP